MVSEELSQISLPASIRLRIFMISFEPILNYLKAAPLS